MTGAPSPPAAAAKRCATRESGGPAGGASWDEVEADAVVSATFEAAQVFVALMQLTRVHQQRAAVLTQVGDT